MKIKLYVKDTETDEILEVIGTCITDSPGRAIQMYDDAVNHWSALGYNASIEWDDITNQAASALGKIKSEKKAAASRENGKKGGRPRNIHKMIRNELKELGINRAVAENIICDGTPAVMLRWNGREEIVMAGYFTLGIDEQYFRWLRSEFADENLK